MKCDGATQLSTCDNGELVVLRTKPTTPEEGEQESDQQRALVLPVPSHTRVLAKGHGGQVG